MSKFVRSTVLLSSVLSLSLGLNLVSVHAEENTDADVGTAVEEVVIKGEDKAKIFVPKTNFDNLSVTDVDGSVTYYNTLEDMKLDLTYRSADRLTLKPIKTNDSVLKDGAQEDVTGSIEEDYSATKSIGETYLGSETKKMKFLGNSKYTPDWAPASGYNLTYGMSDTFSSTFNTGFGDVSASFTRTYGIETSLPADKKRYSKVAGYADLKIQTWRVSRPNVSISYYRQKVTKLNTYVKVRYKK